MNKPERAWQIAERIAIPESILQSVNGNELIASALYQRGIIDQYTIQSFLDPSKYHPIEPENLPEVVRAVDFVISAIQKKEPILVWGDFDVDGQTSTAILVSTLRTLGAKVSFHVPVRGPESHGINPDVLQSFLASGIKLMITCDTGITANPAIDLATKNGIKVIITDHHQLPGDLPNADVIINPQFWQSDHPLRTLSGAGVAFILARALFESTGHTGEIESLYDMVALGLVGDLVELKKDTRFLVQQGLEKLRDPKRPAIQKLITKAEINPEFINEEHLSFSLVPRLNAIGRLGDSNQVVDFFLSEDEEFLEQFSLEIEKLNGKRKLLSEQVFQAAISQLNSSLSLSTDPILVISGPSWPGGVLGLVASRLVGLYFKPVIIFSTSENGLAIGSARSIEGFDLYQAISSCRDLLVSFGGHPMAAGLGLKPESLPEFRRRIIKYSAERIESLISVRTLQIDQVLSFDQILLEQIQEMEKLAPFGPGNPALVFASQNLILENSTPVGKGKEHLSVTVRDEKKNLRKMIWWQGAGNPLPDTENPVDIAYKLRTSNFRGNLDVQMEWIDWRPSVQTPISIQNLPKYDITDLRDREEPEILLTQYSKQSNTVIWGEGIVLPGGSVFDRFHLHEAETLVIATIPPGRQEIEDAISIVNPKKLVLFPMHPEDLKISDILTKVIGMWKYATSKNDFANIIGRMSSKLNTRSILIEYCLKYLFATNELQISEEIPANLIEKMSSSSSDSAKFLADIKKILSEINAFRKYYQRANFADLI